MVGSPSKGLNVFRGIEPPGPGVDTEMGVICGVVGISDRGGGFGAEADKEADTDAAFIARECELSLRRFGASLIFGCV
jgi:hypothetical protein